MLPIRILAVSKPTSGPYHDLVSEYTKRLRAFAAVEFVWVKPEAFRAESERAHTRNLEAERITEKILDDSFVIVLDETGKNFDTQTFSKKIGHLKDEGRPITIVIGGPLGTDDTLRSRADLVLSLSPFTLPHDLALVVLVEQLYRGFMILCGKTYHY